jgi:hypothetical protein
MHRRQILTGSAGLVGMGALMPMLAQAQAQTMAPGPASGGASGFNPADPVQNAEVLARMNLGIDPGTNYGWFKGRVFAVIGDDKVIEPLFDLEGFGANRMIPLGDARYQSLHREVGFYKDLRTGQIMESWKNPFIDEVVKVSHIHNDPVNSVIGPTIEAKLGEGMVTKFPLALPWTMMGDLAMTSFDVNTRWKNVLDPKEWPRESSGGEYVRVSEFLQFVAKRADLENWRNLKRIPTHGSWQRLGTWLPWMLMGSKPGHLFYRSHTKSLGSTDELPADIRAYTQKHFPLFLEAPEKWVTPNVTSFEVYKLENKPQPPKPL